ncbi:uncharacterized protein K452DRAFT_21268 [Aplosporella prunicola CBS 121167]|uniref:Uncharacterized protein n=1 Tax=Aplosporella prunicola CBS 121167 TaxID=1176127 RepID=A0A6A6BG95_9PEZI|nr:uncharacterized protein K452DRAFT_21268 [Aplosporella prunicola CBS 121167]KAF2142598.1 hypothetical protein K452DRAFT_21268 [Aplosporella prunicola CBS 121167]
MISSSNFQFATKYSAACDAAILGYSLLYLFQATQPQSPWRAAPGSATNTQQATLKSKRNASFGHKMKPTSDGKWGEPPSLAITTCGRGSVGLQPALQPADGFPGSRRCAAEGPSAAATAAAAPVMNQDRRRLCRSAVGVTVSTPCSVLCTIAHGRRRRRRRRRRDVARDCCVLDSVRRFEYDH